MDTECHMSVRLMCSTPSFLDMVNGINKCICVQCNAKEISECTCKIMDWNEIMLATLHKCTLFSLKVHWFQD